MRSDDLSVYVNGSLYRAVHYDYLRMVYTFERVRRFFKGRYLVLTREQVVHARSHLLESPLLEQL